MEYTIKQYNEAIHNLELARQQLMDGTQSNGCSICGGNCHPDECNHNPLHAMSLCNQVAEMSAKMHDVLHYFSGYETKMGESIGPNAVVNIGVNKR